MQSQTAFTVISETVIVLSLRAVLFLASRKYLLRSLYPDLRDLSADPELVSAVNEETELDELPTPSTASIQREVPSLLSTSRKRTFHSTLSRTLFSLCFSEMCTLFILLMFQGLNLLGPQTRLFNWKLSLVVLMSMIILLIPLSYSLVLSYRSATGVQTLHRPTTMRIIITMLPVAGFLFLLSFIPLPSGLASSSVSTKLLSRLTVVGTVILGVLSGFGAISNAWAFFPVLSRTQKKQPTNQGVSAAEQGLQRVRDDLAERRRSVQQIEASQPKQEASWFSNVMPSFRGDSQLTGAYQEIQGLEALENQMAQNLRALKQQQAEAKFARTLGGKAFSWGGRLFALYCVYRIIVSALNLVFPSRRTPSGANDQSTSQTDMLTIALAYLLSLVPTVNFSHDDVEAIARQVSLALVGVIILSSIRMVLRGVARVLRVTSRNLGASLMLLMLAQLMGIYLLSTLVQLRTTFPPPEPSHTGYDPALVNLFATLPEYQVFGSVFDASFLLAAVISAAARWFDQRINSVGVLDDS